MLGYDFARCDSTLSSLVWWIVGVFKEVLLPLPGLTQVGLGCLFNVEIWTEEIEWVSWSWGDGWRDVQLFGNLLSATACNMRSGVLTKSLERETVISFRRLTENESAYRRSQGYDISSILAGSQENSPHQIPRRHCRDYRPQSTDPTSSSTFPNPQASQETLAICQPFPI
jgi:hypothetical protein